MKKLLALSAAFLFLFGSSALPQGPNNPNMGGPDTRGRVPLTPTALTFGKTLFIDTTPRGNDFSAGRGRIDKPYATLAGAVSAAQSGDRITWIPGSYTPASGAVTINKSNLIIEAYGVTLNAVDQTDTTKIIITAPNVTIKGLTVDGKYVNAGSPVNDGLIRVQAVDTTLIDVTTKQTAGHGFQFGSGDYSRTKLYNCVADSCQIGYYTSNDSTNINGLDFQNCTAKNGRDIGTSLGGFKMAKNAGGAIRNLKIIGCTSKDNAPGNTQSLGIELFGSFDGAILSGNYVAGNSYGISIALGCVNTIVNSNVIHAGTYTALEFADNLAGAGNQAFGNTLIAQDEAGAATQTNGTMALLSVSNNSGNTDAGLILSNNILKAAPRGIKVRNVDGVTIRGNKITGSSGCECLIQMLYDNNYTIENNETYMPTDSGYVGVWSANNPSTTLSTYRIYNNRFNSGAATGTYSPIYFYVASGSATFNDVRIERNITNVTSRTNGFIGTAAGVTLNAAYYQNTPENGTSTAGFPISIPTLSSANTWTNGQNFLPVFSSGTDNYSLMFNNTRNGNLIQQWLGAESVPGTTFGISIGGGTALLLVRSGSQALIGNDSGPTILAGGNNPGLKLNSGDVESYLDLNPLTAGSQALGSASLPWKALFLNKTITGSGTTGAQTINKASGTVRFAASATSLVVTDSLVTSTTKVLATVQTNDSTLKSVQAVAGSGSFTLFANAAATTETEVYWEIRN